MDLSYGIFFFPIKFNRIQFPDKNVICWTCKVQHPNVSCFSPPGRMPKSSKRYKIVPLCLIPIELSIKYLLISDLILDDNSARALSNFIRAFCPSENKN